MLEHMNSIYMKQVQYALLVERPAIVIDKLRNFGSTPDTVARRRVLEKDA